MEIATTEQRAAFVSEDFESSDMDMDQDGMRRAAFFMRDGVYSNKPLAVAREYLANALDEHQKFQVARPVEVTLPTIDSPVFKVRDFGMGLDDFGVRKIFGCYFKSTKNKDRNLIGGYGIGSKSAHSYGDQFSVTSWNDGIRTDYSCILEGEGEMAIGKILRLNEDFSDDPSGIEIAVPVLQEDLSYNDRFRESFNTLVSKLPPEYNILVDGVLAQPKIFLPDSNLISGLTNGGKRWEIIPNNVAAVTIVVGFVPYSVAHNTLVSNNICSADDAAILAGLVLEAGPSDVSVVLSRESVELSKTKTIPWLQEQFSDIVSRIVEEARAKLAACQTFSEAVKVYRSFPTKLARRKDCQEWNTIHISSASSSLHAVSKDLLSRIVNYDAWKTSLLKSSKLSKWASTVFIKENNGIEEGEDKVFVYDEGERYTKKLVHFAESNQETRILVMTRFAYDTWKLKASAFTGFDKLIEAEPDYFDKFTVFAKDIVLPVVPKQPRQKRAIEEKGFVYSTSVSSDRQIGCRAPRAQAAAELTPSTYLMVCSTKDGNMTKDGIYSSDAVKISKIAQNNGYTVLVVNKEYWKAHLGKIQPLGDWYDNYVPEVPEAAVSGAVASIIERKTTVDYSRLRNAARAVHNLDMKTIFGKWARTLTDLQKYWITGDYYNLRCHKAVALAEAKAAPIARRILIGLEALKKDESFDFVVEVVLSPLFKKYPEKVIDFLGKTR